MGGGHSLDAITLCGRLLHLCGVTVSSLLRAKKNNLQKKQTAKHPHRQHHWSSRRNSKRQACNGLPFALSEH